MWYVFYMYGTSLLYCTYSINHIYIIECMHIELTVWSRMLSVAVSFDWLDVSWSGSVPSFRGGHPLQKRLVVFSLEVGGWWVSAVAQWWNELLQGMKHWSSLVATVA